ncbi:hypothetical protein Mnod_2173 [Methylobacterium nodulans ORS 2060]|uniref:Uncharacterized protein n=1 Tax=Methylobacterium nodulans (strain LMG 21967 / CNCM I-2342 / ORS 2060) TaxID=460265 RepID=B8IUT7_METNO|nr:hypothetical protein Mnod_2173 [Methylobacterium nodulans ORS 2060]
MGLGDEPNRRPISPCGDAFRKKRRFREPVGRPIDLDRP